MASRITSDMDEAARREELKEFLRARREALRPGDLGLLAGRRRRTPGLRREEVAAAADVGVTWYTWLEQGRAIKVSRDALQRIGCALRLTASDEAYLLTLAGVAPAPADAPQDYCVEAHLRTVMDALRTVPALVLGPYIDVRAFNALADAIFDLRPRDGPFENNHAWRLFLDPKRRALYALGWEEVALRTVGVLRARHARYFGDPKFDALLGALRANSPEFVRFWNGGRTAALENIETTLCHPRFRHLKVGVVRLLLPTEPDVFLSTLPAADAKTASVFSRFASRSAVIPFAMPSRLPRARSSDRT
jgi:transcriptional regulator with XRE-family HTH domain